MDRQYGTTCSTTTLNIVGDVKPSCDVLRVALYLVPWYPFCLVTTSCCAHNSARMPRIFGPAPYHSNLFSSQPCYMMQYAFLSSRNTNNSGSWSTLTISCERFISMVAIPVPLPTQNPRRMPWKFPAFLVCVSIKAFITFQRTSKSHTCCSWVLV